MSIKPHSHQDAPAEAAHKPVPKGERTLSDHPADPNRTGAGRQFPPGMIPKTCGTRAGPPRMLLRSITDPELEGFKHESACAPCRWRYMGDLRLQS
ncbi:Uncharacterised protein [Achromobacter kerstersii]|nr:Uncharacterised protein [Achromobacter kerstersii]